MLSLSDKPIREIYVGYNPAPGGFCNAVLFCGFMSNAEVEIFEDGERGTGRSYYPIALLFFRCYAFLAVPTLWGTVQV